MRGQECRAGGTGMGQRLAQLCSCTAESRNVVLLSSAVRCHLKHMYQNSCSIWELERDPEQPDGGNREPGSDEVGAAGLLPPAAGSQDKHTALLHRHSREEKLFNLMDSMGTNPGVP